MTDAPAEREAAAAARAGADLEATAGALERCAKWLLAGPMPPAAAALIEGAASRLADRAGRHRAAADVLAGYAWVLQQAPAAEARRAALRAARSIADDASGGQFGGVGRASGARSPQPAGTSR